MRYSDSSIRTLTIEPSNTNKAHDVWYNYLTPLQRLDVMAQVNENLPPQKRLNACLNYIEDNLEQFAH